MINKANYLPIIMWSAIMNASHKICQFCRQNSRHSSICWQNQ